MTQFIGVSPTDGLGYKQFYRLTFATRGLYYDGSSDVLNYIYNHIQDTGVLGPLSPNPVVPGAKVMTVDVWTIGDSTAVSVSEGVRRLSEVAGWNATLVSIAKLSGIGEVTRGAADRQLETESVAAARAANDPLRALSNFVSGLGGYVTLAVFGLIAYATILVASKRR